MVPEIIGFMQQSACEHREIGLQKTLQACRGISVVVLVDETTADTPCVVVLHVSRVPIPASATMHHSIVGTRPRDARHVQVRHVERWSGRIDGPTLLEQVCCDFGVLDNDDRLVECFEPEEGT